ncbi:palmitoyltransferase PFA5 [Xylariomycetidae sp. FL0641]|nr:palmitoyltransferase PFA5 [Xylariomycetidae sp. FL0641]
MPITESTKAATRWVTRVIPIVLAACVGYATYVVVARVCSDDLIKNRHQNGAAIAILVLYFLFLLLMTATYFRTIIAANVDPGLVPLGPLAIERRKVEENKRKEKKKKKQEQPGDVESQAYFAGPDNNPDSPGLEHFYTKDVFVCESDGRPKWCSECSNWKVDRVHHSSEIGRCVYRMDHYCPWAGGMIGENSFKFFVQFVTYTAAYCAIVLGATASTIRKQSDEGRSVDPYLIVAIAIAAFFGFFTFLMSITSLRYVFLNMTNVDMLSSNSKVYQLAVRVPRGTKSSDKFSVVTYPLPEVPAWLTHGHIPPDHRVEPAVERDDLATRTFAIVKTESGENPWDLGYWGNWKEVMGPGPLDWILPLRRSPCVNHESEVSFYPMGPVLSKVRGRHGLSDSPKGDSNGLEMR